MVLDSCMYIVFISTCFDNLVLSSDVFSPCHVMTATCVPETWMNGQDRILEGLSIQVFSSSSSNNIIPYAPD